jgi:molecular chaperone HtpG
MTRDELVRNLGTIAHSGSREYVRQMAERGDVDSSIIGASVCLSCPAAGLT